MTSIADFHNAHSGPVALLGNGRSLAQQDLAAIALHMPLFGMNRSWKLASSRWTCFVDAENDEELLRGVAPFPEVVFCLDVGSGIAARHRRRSVQHTKLPGGVARERVVVIPQRFGEPRFSGADLDRGSCGLFAGYFALEIVAWMGFNPIYLLGYDGTGGRFYDPPDVPGASEKETATWNARFHEARPVLDALGVRVVNCCPGSAIDAFEIGEVGSE